LGDEGEKGPGADQEAQATQQLKKEEGGEKSLGIKVLLVEDDNFLRSICSKKLVKEGFTVYEALDGEMALSEVEKIKPDIILLDIILPAIDGFEVLNKIRSHSNKQVANSPIIMLSNLGQDDDIKKALSMGANDYLVKAHFTIEEIVTKVKKVLGK
jgi:DNA-binding response OmpR family regulator